MVNEESLSGLGFLISDVARLLRRKFARKAQSHALTEAQWRAIARLSHSGEINQVELASLLESNPMTVCRLVERMDAAGLVERIADPHDRRARLVRLTPKSAAIFDDIRAIAADVYEEALEGITESERRTLVSVLRRINANLQAQLGTTGEEAAT